MNQRDTLWILTAVLNATNCSMQLEHSSSFILRSNNQVVVFPFIFRGCNIAVLPTAKYSDLRRNPKRMEDSEPLFCNISHIIWSFTIGGVAYKDDDRFKRLFSERMEGYLKDISSNASKVYMKGNKTFSEFLEAVYKRIFQCDGKQGGHVMRYGEDVMKEIGGMMENAPPELSEEEKRQHQRLWGNIKKYTEYLYNIERLKRLIEVEKMVCDACKEICLGLREEELMGLLAEGRMRKSLKVKLGEEEAGKKGYLEYAIVNDEILLDAHREYGGDVTKELVMQMLLGKKGEEIDKRYINKVANMIKERQRRREREIEKRVKKLLRDEEKAKIKKKGKKKKKRSAGVPENKEEEKKESETEEVEAGEETEMLSEEVGGARRKTGKKSEGGRKRYKIHRRVLRWRKSPEKIKKEWDRGSEERWRGRSLEEIKEQKVFHDIVGVLELLRSEDAENSSWMQESTPRAGVRGRGWWRLGFLRAEERGC
ncbi:DUF3654 domain-containing protein [Encephalitozoon cuniculi]|nr:DUF3654 domain-containing protein [Encephalitozoon cuniculi]